MVSSLLFGAVLSLLLLNQSAALADPCAAIQASMNSSGEVPVRPSELSACLNSFPFSRSIANATLDTLIKATGAYVFRGATNIVATLNSMYNKVYPSERAFHNAVRAAFIATGDTHLIYQSTCFHKFFSAKLPLPITGIQWPNGTTEIAVITSFFDETDPIWPGVNLTDYAGATVSHINGFKAVTVLKAFASNPPDYIARDWGVRFNLALAHSGWYYPGSGVSFEFFDTGAFSRRQGSIPTSDYVTLTLRRQGSTTWEKVKVPWSVTALFPDDASFGTTAAEYYAANCALPVQTTSGVQGRAALSDPEAVLDTRRRLLPKGRSLAAASGPSRRRLLEESSTLLLTGAMQAYGLADNVTGVLVIPSFNFVQSFTESQFVFQLNRRLNAIKSWGGTRLIIDLRGNNGGRINLGYQLVNTLFPSIGNPSPRFVLPGTRYAQRLVQSAAQYLNDTICMEKPCRYFYRTWLENSLQRISKFYSFFFPVTSTYIPIPKVNRRSPGFTYLPVSQIFRQPSIPGTAASSPAPFAADQVILLSDGSCQSTCAMISHVLRWRLGVKIAFIGGLETVNPTISNAVSNPAGGVLQLSELLAEINTLGEEGEPHHPTAFPIQATFSFSLRAAMQERSTAEPSRSAIDAFEYLPIAPNFRIYSSWDVAESTQAAWDKTATFFT